MLKPLLPFAHTLALALAGLVVSGSTVPARAQVAPDNCWAVFPSPSREDNMFLSLDKNYYILYDTVSVAESLDSVSHKLDYSVRTYVDISTGAVIGAAVSTLLTNNETGFSRFQEAGELHLLSVILPTGREVSDLGLVTLFVKRADLVKKLPPTRLDPLLGEQLYADIVASRSINLRFSVSRGSAKLLSSRVADNFAAKPDYRKWASSTPKKLAIERTNSGQCPIQRRYR